MLPAQHTPSGGKKEGVAHVQYGSNWLVAAAPAHLTQPGTANNTATGRRRPCQEIVKNIKDFTSYKIWLCHDDHILLSAMPTRSASRLLQVLWKLADHYSSEQTLLAFSLDEKVQKPPISLQH